MCLSAIIGLGSALIQGSTAKRAADTQAQAGKDALKFQQKKYKAGMAALDPFADTSGLDAYKFELGIGDRPEGYGGYQESAGFQNMLTAGRDTIEGGASAGGKLYSGATGTALEKFRMGLASRDVNTYLDRLGNLGSMGAQAAGAQAGIGTQFAGMGSSTITDIGSVTAAGQVGVGNAIAGGIDAGLGAYGMMQGTDPNWGVAPSQQGNIQDLFGGSWGIG